MISWHPKLYLLLLLFSFYEIYLHDSITFCICMLIAQLFCFNYSGFNLFCEKIISWPSKIGSFPLFKFKDFIFFFGVKLNKIYYTDRIVFCWVLLGWRILCFKYFDCICYVRDLLFEIKSLKENGEIESLRLCLGCNFLCLGFVIRNWISEIML